MEAAEEQTENELQFRLSRLLKADGSWDPSAIEELDPDAWAEWFRRRLAGSDPHFGYDREDYATHPGNLFRSLFEELDSVDTRNAAEGLAQHLNSLDPPTSEGMQLREAIDLILHVRPRYTPARDDLRETLREWIDEESLLQREGDSVAPETLHRKALFALAALQYPGGLGPNGERNDDRDIETFRAWLDHPDVAEAAFSGLGLALPSTPRSGVLADFLELCDEEGIHPKHPLETLFIDRQNGQEIRAYLWEEIQALDDPEMRWAQIREWLGEDYYLPSYSLMETRSGISPRSVGDGAPSSSTEEKGPSWTISFESLRKPA